MFDLANYENKQEIAQHPYYGVLNNVIRLVWVQSRK